MFSQQLKKIKGKQNLSDKYKYFTTSGKYNIFIQMTHLEKITADLVVKTGLWCS
nr:hypothetical protein [Enterobacter mori]